MPLPTFARELLNVLIPSRRKFWHNYWSNCHFELSFLRLLASDYSRLAEIKREPCNLTALGTWQQDKFINYISSEACTEEWQTARKELPDADFPNTSGGVSSVDRRLLFHLVKYLAPARVLEIGTHIGASTVHLALAMKNDTVDTDRRKFISVDLREVNDPEAKHWLKFGGKLSPGDMVESMGCGDFAALVHLGSTVTHAMLQLAYHLGCDPMYTIGLDHNYNQLPNLFPPGTNEIVITEENFIWCAVFM